MNLPSWMNLTFDTQILGALIQVFAAGIVAWYVQWKSSTDRRVATAVAMDQEWNTKEMIHSRHMVQESMNNNLGIPTVSSKYFESLWMVRMFFIRLAHMKRDKLIDEKLFAGLLARDAGAFSQKVHEAWGEDVVSADDLALIRPCACRI